MTDPNSDIAIKPEGGDPIMRPFHVDIVEEAEATRVAPVGELDLATVDDVAEALAAARERQVQCVVLDLRGLAFIDSVGIGLLLGERRHAAAAGHRFELIQGPSAVQRTLEIAGITRLFTIRRL